MVSQTLPESALFLIEPNTSYDGNAVPGDEDLFPQDSLPTGKTLGPLDATAATRWLWRAGKIPEWIDVRAYDSSSSASILWLMCCGRFTANADLLYHEREGNQPFHVTSPVLPPGWTSVESDGLFDLEARRQR